MARDLRSSDVKDLEIRHAADGTELIPCEINGRDVYLTAAMIAAINTGSGLPPQWSEGGNGNVIATVDDVAATALTIEGLAGQTAALFAVVNALAANLFTVSPDGETVATVVDPTKTPLTVQRGNDSTNVTSIPVFQVLSPQVEASALDNNNEMFYVGSQNRPPPFNSQSGDNGITVVVVNDGASQPLTVTDDGTSAVTIHLATDGGGTVTSTVQDVFDAVNVYSGVPGFTHAVQVPNFAPTDLASTTGTITLFGGREAGSVKVNPGGTVAIQSGDVNVAALDILGDEAGVQIADLIRVICNGYGLTVNKDGTLVMLNDDDLPSAQFWVNDGVDLGFEVEGTGHFRHLIETSPLADGDMANSEYGTWLDDTPSATILHVKAKDSAGNVVTGSLPLA